MAKKSDTGDVSGLSFEAALKELEQIVDRLEGRNSPQDFSAV